LVRREEAQEVNTHMKLEDFKDNDVPEWFTSPARHKRRYFIMRAPMRVDPMNRSLRVKYIGDARVIADVWDWDQANHEFNYTDEISLSTEALHKKYRQLTNPAEIKLWFTDSFKLAKLK